MKRILITGGAGFIGSNFIHYVLKTYKNIEAVNLDALTYAGNLENLSDIRDQKNYNFVHGDVRDRELLKSLFSKYRFDTVVNFAAESHVDRSITAPELFLSTNVLGTQALLDTAKELWSNDPLIEDTKFLQVSTDEVYGSLGSEGKFTEESPIVPNSPYSASKASADLIVRAYHETYGLPVNITRCSNNYGPYQFPEKLIPLMVNNCLENRALPIYGDGMQIRDWLYVEDHCSAICTVLEKGHTGEIYNIGGNNEKANIEIVRLLIRMLEKDESLITHVKDRLGHDRRYAIDNTKITTQLAWRPAWRFEEGLAKTVQWYVSNKDWMEHVTSGDYQRYYETMYGHRDGSL